MNPGHYTAATQLGRNTLELLWSRTRQQGDMPGFAKAISAILGAMRGEDDHAFDMTQTVLSDPVLTHKVLRLANSGMYSAFGQRVNTVSKAVLVLGLDAIGHLALGLKLIEELSQARPDSVSAHAEMEKAVLAGMVAQQVATSAGSLQAEQAVVCSMLHTLGRMMVTFYMADYWARLQAHDGPGNEAAAAPEILGLSLPEVGYATAAHWGLPQHLIDGMRPLAPMQADEVVSSSDWMAGLSTMAARCADSLWHDDANGAAEVHALIDDYAGMLGMQPEAVLEAVEKAKVMAAADLTIAPLSKPMERRARQLASTRLRAEGNRILLDGLADLRGAIGTANPGQMVSMALETLHQGFDFSRSVAFARNHKEQLYSARICMGEGAAELQDLMVFGDVYEPNVFHAALSSDRVIFIDNARDPKFAAKLPPWWNSTLSEARSFVVLPLSANGHPTGFLYGDWDDSFPPIQLNQTEFNLINDIRTLLVQSVEMRHQQELAANKVA
ncbi:HDOD domain-containing protein [Janthinobacterium sp. RB2R34]|uniref:HDOD domain-containing protein n=1 Tax=Janthinobacterium sp. RB2R34 TaxID=3424193 RepID=UPI003F25B57D